MVATFVALALIVLWIVRRYCKPYILIDLTDFGEIFCDAIGVVFALILAFAAVAVWENYDKVDDGVSKEAKALHNIYRNLESYPEPLSSQSRKLILEYVQVIIKDEWPKLAIGKEDKNAHRMLSRIKSMVFAFNPRNNGELVLHQETMRLLSEYNGYRFDRIIGGRPNLTPPIWLMLNGGTILFIIFLCFFDIPDFKRHAMMLAFMTAFIGLVYYMLVVYNFPFSEPGAISPEPFQTLLEEFKSGLI